MAVSKVYIVGGTGYTGSVIVDAILEKGAEFALSAAVRPESANKPAVMKLRERGVDVRIIEISSASHEQLVEELQGIDIVISTIFPTQYLLQKPLALAAKEAGVKRFIPCDWATSCERGVMMLHDFKCEIQDYIKEIGLGYTFIDVGWWSQNLALAVNTKKAYYPETVKYNLSQYGTGDVKTAITDLRDIGPYVARIIQDERTLNRYVFIWAEEVTQNQTFAMAERILGKKLNIPQIDAEELQKGLATAEGILPFVYQYMKSLWVRGDNTIENAKKEQYGGALDVKELYPDYKPRTLEQLMQEWYTESYSD